MPAAVREARYRRPVSAKEHRGQRRPIDGARVLKSCQLAVALLLAILASVSEWTPAQAAAGQPPDTTACNQPSVEPITWVDLPGSHAFQAVPTHDGCWIFVSLATGDAEASDSDAAANVAVFARRGGHISLVRVVHVGGNPNGMVLTHDGRLLVVADGNRVAFLDTHKLTLQHGSPVLGYWNDGTKAPGRTYVNVTLDDKYLFISDENVGTVTVLDLAKARTSRFAPTATVGRIPVGNGPIAVTLSPDDRYLYTTSLNMPPAPEWPVECKPEWDPQAPPNTQGAIFIVDVVRAKTDPARSVIATAKAGCTPVRLVLSPQGDVAYVTARGEDALLAFDTHRLLLDPKRALIGTVPTGSTPIGIAVIAGGREVVLTNSNRFGTGPSEQQSLMVVDTTMISAGKDAILGTVPAGSLPREMRLTADQRTLLVVNTVSRKLQVIDLARLPMLPRGVKAAH
jgi:DNA-binding beta-propeller fold protein YncE